MSWRQRLLLMGGAVAAMDAFTGPERWYGMALKLALALFCLMVTGPDHVTPLIMDVKEDTAYPLAPCHLVTEHEPHVWTSFAVTEDGGKLEKRTCLGKLPEVAV